jgi:hypothetical protein
MRRSASLRVRLDLFQNGVEDRPLGGGALYASVFRENPLSAAATEEKLSPLKKSSTKSQEQRSSECEEAKMLAIFSAFFFNALGD